VDVGGSGVRLLARAAALDRRRLAAALAVVIAALGALGVLEDAGFAGHLFDLDGEGNVPAGFSAGLLLLCAAASGLVGAAQPEPGDRRAWLAFGAFLAYMGLDEALTVHERVSRLAGGEDWQVLYLPLVAVGGLAWLAVLRRTWPRTGARALLLAGAALWLASQVIEHVESGPATGRVAGYGALSTAEELLEMSGSALFLLALLGPVERIAVAQGRALPAAAESAGAGGGARA
jgi:hypothetical protein